MSGARMSERGSLTPVYDSRLKKYETTRRRIFKDSDGKYKEHLEIEHCEKRTLFGSPPFEANSNWKLEDLSDIEKEPTKSHRRNNRKDCAKTPQSGDFHGNNARVRTKRDFHVDEATFERHFKNTLEKILSKLRNENKNNNREATDNQGIKKIYENERADRFNGFSTTTSN